MSALSLRPLLVALAIALAPGAALAGAVYKCPGPDGKVEYRDVPCAEGKKLETEFNSIDGRIDPELERQVREFNARVDARARQRREANAAIAADNDAFRRECQSYLDDAARQRPWLDSHSETARKSAHVEIGIARRKYADAGCR
jgi:Skp family chaperone for outer membrane proteins